VELIICIPGHAFSRFCIVHPCIFGPAFISTAFWSLKLDIIGRAFSCPAFSGPPFSAPPLLTKLGMIDYGTPPHMKTLVGVVQLGWSGQIRDMSHL